MSYAIIRNQKLTRVDAQGSYIHNDRRSKGHSNKDIAHLLRISERTVKNHLCNIFRKIDCDDRTQAAVFCIRNGIVSVHD